jgi:hypothetical protein
VDVMGASEILETDADIGPETLNPIAATPNGTGRAGAIGYRSASRR